MNLIEEQARKAKRAGIEQALALNIDSNVRVVALREGKGPHLFCATIDLDGFQLRLKACRGTGANSVQAEIVDYAHGIGSGRAVIVYRAVEHNPPEAFRPGHWVNVLAEHAKVIRRQQGEEAQAKEIAKAKATIKAFSRIEMGGARE